MAQAGNNSRPVMSVDIGGTKIMVAVFSGGGQMLDREQIPTLADEGVAAVVGRLAAAADDLLRRNSLEASQLGAVGIAAAGAIDTGRGLITASPNLPGWLDIPLGKMLEDRYGTPSLLINDASAAALGEHRYGAGRGAKHVVMITLGTGIGGGIIIDGELYLGVCGSAGEIGHMVIEAEGPACPCGSRGCLEMLASGTAVAREAQNRLRAGEGTLLREMCNGRAGDIGAEMVAAAARRGDALAKEIFLKAAGYLGIGLANIVNIFNPEVIIIGGGMAGEGDLILGPATEVMSQRAFRLAAGAVRITTAELGNQAGIYGAAAYVFDRIGRQA